MSVLVQPIRRDYLDVVSGLIRAAKSRVWVHMFIVDARIGVDHEQQVLHLLLLLRDAAKRGVDVRLLVGDSRASPDIRICTKASAKIAAILGVEARQYRLSKKRSTHGKYLLVDDAISVVGSHNWEPGAFEDFVEDSICINSSRLNARLRRNFAKGWSQARRVEPPIAFPVKPEVPAAPKQRHSQLYPATHAALVIDGTYLRTAKRLLDRAMHSIDIRMFYISSSKRNGAIGTLVSSVVDAHKRGVRTRVLLDRDRPGDVYRSGLINAKAYRTLKNNGVAVRYDSKKRVTHSKLVIVDERRVLVGSHNWTIGSMASYHEVSALVDSQALARNYCSNFQKSWRAR